MEQVNLTTNFVADPRSASTLQVDSLLLNWRDKRIVVHLGDGNLQKMVEYTGAEAENLMITLNKANLTTNSLHKRVINKLIADGHIAGSISGSPD